MLFFLVKMFSKAKMLYFSKKILSILTAMSYSTSSSCVRSWSWN
jgi:hypothetical protein